MSEINWKEEIEKAPAQIIKMVATDPLDALYKAFMLGVGSKTESEINRFKNLIEGAKAQDEALTEKIKDLQNELGKQIQKTVIIQQPKDTVVTPYWYQNGPTCNAQSTT